MSNTRSENDFVAFWNDILAPKFIAYRHVLVDGFARQTAEVFSALPVGPGDRVLDVGCGFGETTLELARRVSPGGTVLGVDCCEAFVRIAGRDRADAGIDNARFELADVESYRFEPEHDLCFSRFGTMFFANPVAGLRNMRASLKSGGRMIMLVWRRMQDNPWVGLPKQIVSRYLPPPDEPARSCGPGPFSMADPRQVSAQLRAAGYTGVSFERIDAPVFVGNTPREAAAFALALGPAGELVREAGEEAQRRLPTIEAALREAMDAYRTDQGVLMQSSAWKVTAANG